MKRHHACVHDVRPISQLTRASGVRAGLQVTPADPAPLPPTVLSPAPCRSAVLRLKSGLLWCTTCAAQPRLVACMAWCCLGKGPGAGRGCGISTGGHRGPICATARTGGSQEHELVPGWHKSKRWPAASCTLHHLQRALLCQVLTHQ